MDPRESREKYRMRLAQKRKLFTDYSNATRCLKQSLEEKNEKQSAACIKQRTRIIHKIQKTNKTIDNETKKTGSNIHLFHDAEIINIQNEIRTLMAQGSTLDKECAQLARIERDAIKAELLNLRKNRSRAGGYRKNAYHPSRFVDIRN